MNTYVSVLRGINVSGHRKVPMAALKDLYTGLGFTDVATYIQSGNVVFRDKGSADLSSRIEEKINEVFGFEVPVIIRTGAELEDILRRNPFLKEEDIDVAKLHVTFLAKEPEPAGAAKLQDVDAGADRWILSGKEMFLYCPGGYGNTRLSNAFLESKLKVTATTRNWKTVGELARLAGNCQP